MSHKSRGRGRVVPTQMECLAFEWVWVDWFSFLSTRSGLQPVISYPGKKTVHESDLESQSSYLEPTQRWRNIIAVHVDVVQLSDSLMTFFRHAKNLSGCSPTKRNTSSTELCTMVSNTYLVRMGSVYSTPLANSPAPIRARHSNQVRVCFHMQCSGVTFRFSQISKHLLFFFKDFIRGRLFRCIWREITCREPCSEYVSLLLWIFFNSLIWSSKVKFACGPTVISSAAAWLFPSDPDGCLLLSPLLWPPCIPPMTLCSYKRNRTIIDSFLTEMSLSLHSPVSDLSLPSLQNKTDRLYRSEMTVSTYFLSATFFQRDVELFLGTRSRRVGLLIIHLEFIIRFRLFLFEVMNAHMHRERMVSALTISRRRLAWYLSIVCRRACSSSIWISDKR